MKTIIHKQNNAEEKAAFNPTEKKQLFIFLLISFGFPILMGILMCIGFNKGYDLTTFPNVQMFFPAAGVMLALILTRDKEQNIPLKFYIGFLIHAAVLVVIAVLSIILPTIGWGMISQYVIIIGSIILWILFAIEKKAARKEYGLSFSGIKKSKPLLYVLIFLGLYLLRLAFAYLIDGEISQIMNIYTDPSVWMLFIIITINFVISFSAFFGEEYGWRYFLQPMLQKKFGLRWGVLVLGVMWGLWHLPINVFYYSPQTWLQSVLSQQITCISLAIFFGYAYMKTQNIWVPVLMHFFNNNLIAVFSGTTSISNQVIGWKDILVLLVLNVVLFVPVIFSGVFNKKEPDSLSQS